MDNTDDIFAKLTPEQQLEMAKILETLNSEMEHSDGVKELKSILEARDEALKMLKQNQEKREAKIIKPSTMIQMKKITGFISCLTAVIILSALLFTFFKEEAYKESFDLGTLLFILAVIICSSCVIHYTVTTKFWKTTEFSTFESLERENELIEKQIKNKELQLRLENLDKKS